MGNANFGNSSPANPVSALGISPAPAAPPNLRMLEICIDSVASAKAAAAAGADRVELCSNLPEGGVTPSAGLIRIVRTIFPGALMILIRPRGYDFLYTDAELDVMAHDIHLARALGADGVVIGCLTLDGRVDLQRCRQLQEAAESMDVTFHRAFDMSRDLSEALADLETLGIRRILTSGGQADVSSGADNIADLVRRAAGRVSFMPGGGVTEHNLADVLRRTGAREIHLSARDFVHSAMKHRNELCFMGAFSKDHEYQWREATVEKIQSAKRALSQVLAHAI
jgi:copper homeostasis protein